MGFYKFKVVSGKFCYKEECWIHVLRCKKVVSGGKTHKFRATNKDYDNLQKSWVMFTRARI